MRFFVPHSWRRRRRRTKASIASETFFFRSNLPDRSTEACAPPVSVCGDHSLQGLPPSHLSTLSLLCAKGRLPRGVNGLIEKTEGTRKACVCVHARVCVPIDRDKADVGSQRLANDRVGECPSVLGGELVARARLILLEVYARVENLWRRREESGGREGEARGKGKGRGRGGVRGRDAARVCAWRALGLSGDDDDGEPVCDRCADAHDGKRRTPAGACARHVGFTVSPEREQLLPPGEST